MKYKSEVINEIIETSGHVKSTLHYQSECVETWIEEVRGAYPKLTDYEGEWLNYYLENAGVGEFPYLALTNITSATVDNCVPISFKSAILKGQTLVNLINLENFTSSDILYACDLPVTNNTTYTVIATLRGSDKIRTSKESVFRIKANNNDGDDLINAQQIMPNDISTIINLCQTIKITTQNNLHIRTYNTLPENLKIIILEGDHTQEDIPYFEGMKSVQMPVLKSTGKNLFDVKDFAKKCGGTVNGNEYDSTTSETNAVYDIFIPKGYIISYTATQLATDGSPSSSAFAFIGESGKTYHRGLNNFSRFVITAPENLIGIRIVNYCHNWKFSEFQIEESMQETSYEPYQSNILTVNEDVTLRSNGSVHDELDCLTGEVTQRIGEVVLDGSEDGWAYASRGSKTGICYIENYFTTPPTNVITNYFSIIEKRPDVFWNKGQDLESFCVNDKSLAFRIEKTKLKTLDSNGIKEWLSQNNLIIQYDLATESIKTVDLSITNQDGESLNNLNAIEGTMHIETASETIKPLLDIEVPVEAITQNLNSFIEEE